jgi:hypothetical protein
MAAAIKVAILALAPDLKLEDRDHGGKNSFHQSTGLALGPLTYLKRKSERNYDPKKLGPGQSTNPPSFPQSRFKNVSDKRANHYLKFAWAI